MILKVLGQFLSETLEYLDMNLVIDPKELKKFLNHCKNLELKKLLIRNRSKNDLNHDYILLLFDILSYDLLFH